MKQESSQVPMPPEVEAWLGEQSDPDRRALEETWRLAERGERAPSPSETRRKAEVWAAVSKSTCRAEREEMPRPHLRLVTSKTWLGTAAAVAAVIAVFYLLRPISVHAPNGEFAHATLPDGSTVHLNSGSMLTHPAHFLGARNVELEGEAFFDVVKDGAPFVVETFNARTTVLGTEFNVRARRNEATPSTAVVVASGHVRVASRVSGDAAVVVSPGQRSIVTAAERPSRPFEIIVERELAWRHGGLNFTNQPFSVIFAEIERRFDAEITASADIDAEAFSIYLHNPSSAESVLSDVARAQGFRYRQTAHGYEVYRP